MGGLPEEDSEVATLKEQLVEDSAKLLEEAGICNALTELSINRAIGKKEINQAISLAAKLQSKEDFELIYKLSKRLITLFEKGKVALDYVVKCTEAFTKDNPY